jgi:hypothetical protein
LISSPPERPYDRAPVVVEPPTVLPPTSNCVGDRPGTSRARPRMPRPYGQVLHLLLAPVDADLLSTGDRSSASC